MRDVGSDAGGVEGRLPEEHVFDSHLNGDAKGTREPRPAQEKKQAGLRRKRARPRNDEARRRRRRHYWLGALFIFLGILGIFLPILQGILFLVIGLLVLGRVSPRIRLWRWRMRRRFPWWARQYDKVEGRAKEWLAKRKSLRLERRRARRSRAAARNIRRLAGNGKLAARMRAKKTVRRKRGAARHGKGKKG